MFPTPRVRHIYNMYTNPSHPVIFAIFNITLSYLIEIVNLSISLNVAYYAVPSMRRILGLPSCQQSYPENVG